MRHMCCAGHVRRERCARSMRRTLRSADLPGGTGVRPGARRMRRHRQLRPLRRGSVVRQRPWVLPNANRVHDSGQHCGLPGDAQSARPGELLAVRYRQWLSRPRSRRRNLRAGCRHIAASDGTASRWAVVRERVRRTGGNRGASLSSNARPHLRVAMCGDAAGNALPLRQYRSGAVYLWRGSSAGAALRSLRM